MTWQFTGTDFGQHEKTDDCNFSGLINFEMCNLTELLCESREREREREREIKPCPSLIASIPLPSAVTLGCRPWRGEGRRGRQPWTGTSSGVNAGKIQHHPRLPWLLVREGVRVGGMEGKEEGGEGGEGGSEGERDGRRERGTHTHTHTHTQYSCMHKNN